MKDYETFTSRLDIFVGYKSAYHSFMENIFPALLMRKTSCNEFKFLKKTNTFELAYSYTFQKPLWQEVIVEFLLKACIVFVLKYSFHGKI